MTADLYEFVVLGLLGTVALIAPAVSYLVLNTTLHPLHAVGLGLALAVWMLAVTVAAPARLPDVKGDADAE